MYRAFQLHLGLVELGLWNTPRLYDLLLQNDRYLFHIH